MPLTSDQEFTFAVPRCAACLQQERDEARAALETVQAAAPVANGKRAAEEEYIAQPAKKVGKALSCVSARPFSAMSRTVPIPNHSKHQHGRGSASQMLPSQAKAGITDDIVKAMTECSMKLSKGRKQRASPPELASVDDLASFQLLGSQPLHKTGKVRRYAPRHNCLLRFTHRPC